MTDPKIPSGDEALALIASWVTAWATEEYEANPACEGEEAVPLQQRIDENKATLLEEMAEFSVEAEPTGEFAVIYDSWNTSSDQYEDDMYEMFATASEAERRFNEAYATAPDEVHNPRVVEVVRPIKHPKGAEWGGRDIA